MKTIKTGKINKQILDDEIFKILEEIRTTNKIQEDEFWNCVLSQAIHDYNFPCPICKKICGNAGLLAMHMKSPGRGTRSIHKKYDKENN